MLRNPYGCDKTLRNRSYFYLFGGFSQCWGLSCPVQCAKFHFYWPTYCKKNPCSSSDCQRSFQMLRNEGRVIMAWVGWKYFIKLKLLEGSVLNVWCVSFLRKFPLNCIHLRCPYLTPQAWVRSGCFSLKLFLHPALVLITASSLSVCVFMGAYHSCPLFF